MNVNDMFPRLPASLMCSSLCLEQDIAIFFRNVRIQRYKLSVGHGVFSQQDQETSHLPG